MPKPSPKRTPRAKPKARAPRVGDLIYVEWIDSYSNDRWLGEHDFADLIDDAHVCQSTGWLLDRGGGHLSLASDRVGYDRKDGRAGAYGRFMRIPRACVRKVVVLRRAP